MTIIQHVFRGHHAAPQGRLSPFEATCRLVRNFSGLESMHITGWVAVDGTPSPVSSMGITSPGQPMHGRERAIVMDHIAECVRSQVGPAATWRTEGPSIPMAQPTARQHRTKPLTR